MEIQSSPAGRGLVSPGMHLPQRISTGVRIRLIGFVLVLCAGMAAFLHAMGQGLNHDEHQFLAPAALYSHEGLLPYQDYPLFHLPNLVFVYGWLYTLTGDLLFGPKLLSALADTGIIALIFWAAFARFGNALRPWERLWMASGVTILLLFDPLFLYTSGKTWNHEVPTFLLLAAAGFHVESLRGRSRILCILSGLAAGLAAGCRLTFAPPCAAFLLHHLLWGPRSWRERLTLVAAWGGGCLVGLLPSLYFLCVSREAFLFDNLSFPRLSLADPENTRVQKTIKWSNKLRFLLKEVLWRSWPLALLYLSIGVLPLIQAFRHRRSGRGGTVFSVLLTLFALLGCFAPSRYQYQHFFVLSALAAFGIIYRCREMLLGYRERRAVMIATGLLAAVSVIGYLSDDRPSGWRAYLQARAMRDPDAWFSNKFSQQSAVLQRYLPAGVKVVTLSPAVVLSAGRRICPEFATGPFAWRGAHYVPEELRKRYHFVAPEDLPSFMQEQRPFAILTGWEEELEAPLIDYAREHHFEKIELPKKPHALWLNQEAREAKPRKLIETN